MFDSTIDFFTVLLFESPLRLILLAAAIGGVLAYLYRREPGPKYGRCIVALMVVTAAMLVIQRAVVTDREEIRNLIRDLAHAVEANDANFIVSRLDIRYAGEGFSRQTAAQSIRGFLNRYKISIVRLVIREIHPDARKAQASVRALAEVTYARSRYGLTTSGWHLEFRKGSDGWKVSNIRPVMLNNRPVSSMRDIPR